VTTTGRAEVDLVVYLDAGAIGGAEMTLSQVLGGLPERFRVTIVGVERGMGDEVLQWLADARPGTTHRLLDPIDGSRDLRHMREHRRAFRALRPDVILFNLSSMSSCQWAMSAALSLRTVPVVVVENSPMRTWSRTSNLLKRANSSRLAAHVAVGEQTSRIIEETANLRAGSVATMYHGVPAPRLDTPSERRRDDERVIVNVARHDPVKGLDVLLRAMSSIPDNVRLVQVGGGTETESLLALRDELGLGDRVEFRDLPWDQRAADLLAGFDLFVLSSRVEGLPVTIMEAMLAGRAVVATDVGSVREEVIDGETGRVVAPDDAHALAAAVTELVADDARRDEMGRRARAIAEEMFTVDATVDRYVALFDRVLAARPE